MTRKDPLQNCQRSGRLQPGSDRRRGAAGAGGPGARPRRDRAGARPTEAAVAEQGGRRGSRVDEPRGRRVPGFRRGSTGVSWHGRENEFQRLARGCLRKEKKLGKLQRATFACDGRSGTLTTCLMIFLAYFLKDLEQKIRR